MCYLKKLWTLSRPWIYILWVALTTVSCPKRRSSIWRHFWLMRRLDTAAVMYTFLHREWNSDVKESLLLNFGITVWLQISKKIFLFTSDDAKQVCERARPLKKSFAGEFVIIIMSRKNQTVILLKLKNSWNEHILNFHS